MVNGEGSMNFGGKTAVVFGATGAIGTAVSRRLAAEGARVFISGRRGVELERLAGDIGAGWAVVDATEETQVEGWLNDVAKQSDSLDIVFNAIGPRPSAAGYATPSVHLPLDTFLLPLRLIVGSQFLTARVAARRMAAQGRGAIVILSASLSGGFVPFMAGITAACGALEAMTRSLAAEFGPAGVRVNCVRSGHAGDAHDPRDAGVDGECLGDGASGSQGSYDEHSVGAPGAIGRDSRRRRLACLGCRKRHCRPGGQRVRRRIGVVMERGALLAEVYQAARPQLISYVTRMVVRPAIAEELVQQAALRLTESPRPPTDAEGTRAWLFRAATNLAIDHLRRHSTWREDVLLESQELARRDDAFIAESRLLQGSPEMRAIAREHLAVCLACTLRASAPQHAAALLLVEVYGFTVPETADVLGASQTQVKNWIQTIRSRLRDKYAATCALVAKQGVCYQCVELSEFFNRRGEDPLDGTARDVDARLAILREQREMALGAWHRLVMRLVGAEQVLR